MTSEGVTLEQKDGVGIIEFAHPKANSLPTQLLGEIAQKLSELSKDDSVKGILLKSSGEKAFCAGASFEELLELTDLEDAVEYFMGFARVILAMRSAPKCVVTRVQGKAVGGAVGLIAASDYSIASSAASFRLSEFSLGFGPFVISLPVIRKVGVSAFSAMSIDTEWRDAKCGLEQGLYSQVVESGVALDDKVYEFLEVLSKRALPAAQKIKQVAWEGTDHWEAEMKARAEMTAELVLSDEVKARLRAFKKS